MPPAGLEVKDAAGVADRQRSGPLLYRPGDYGLGGLVLGLADPPPVPSPGVALLALVLAPAAGPALPRLRGAAGVGPGAALAGIGHDPGH
jgi:hypothetical protein